MRARQTIRRTILAGRLYTSECSEAQDQKRMIIKIKKSLFFTEKKSLTSSWIIRNHQARYFCYLLPLNRKRMHKWQTLINHAQLYCDKEIKIRSFPRRQRAWLDSSSFMIEIFSCRNNIWWRQSFHYFVLSIFIYRYYYQNW